MSRLSARVGARPLVPRYYVPQSIQRHARHATPAGTCPPDSGRAGERTGSRKVKRLLLNDDYDAIVQVGREQVEGGAHVLDVPVALTERVDEDDQMRKLVKKLSLSVEAP